MRAIWIGMLGVLLGAVGHAAEPVPLRVVVVAEPHSHLERQPFALVKLRAGGTAPLLRRALDGPATAALSRDHSQVYVVTKLALSRQRIEVLASADFALRSTIEVALPIDSPEQAALAELPGHPGVIMLSRCWWIDAATGAVRESPQSLGIDCRYSASSDGLSPSGRLLLLEDWRDAHVQERTLLVDIANPRVPLMELPPWAGPFLDDESAVILDRNDRVELIPIVAGAPTRAFPVPAGWRYISTAGAIGDVLYARYFDSGYHLHVARLDLRSGAWSNLATGLDWDWGAGWYLESLGPWTLLTSTANEWCMISCSYSGAGQLLVNRDTGAVTASRWLQGGAISIGAGLHLQGPPLATAAVPVDAFHGGPALALMIAGVLVVAARASPRSRS